MKTNKKQKLISISNPIEIKKSLDGEISGNFPSDILKAEKQGKTFNQVDYVHACIIYSKFVR
jgi:hypothetical protein